ncbi:hypothetical protein DSC45_22515 [Streptomyces sp. YIM 130001]|uniref:hypothetical protein n=1 Tax=Streptomyces sp. YIM 130001 TaxID=2259644 RepID=UPI000E6550FE|nr:hypothetical protein [Streptomyces sp. YIM 130001]RII13730.1 hypothetical protein DSC45_22515 [Streptomyces sp. YIM 130001]
MSILKSRGFRSAVVTATALGTVAVAGTAASAEPVDAQAGKWKSYGTIYDGKPDKGGIDVITARYWSGNKKTQAAINFQSYGEVWTAHNKTATTATVYGYVNGKLKVSKKLAAGKKWRKNDSFGEGKDVSVKVKLHKRGSASHGGGRS